MADKSRIEWTEATWNPLTGCTKIGQGCVNCYAERMARRLKAMGQPQYQEVVTDDGHWTNKIAVLPEALELPLKWKRPRRIFVNSMSDLFHKDVPPEFLNAVVQVMSRADWHTYQILTKRYDRPFLALNPQDAAPHILIGFSICTQADADKALPYVRMVAEQGWRTWISYEPALEAIDWRGWEFIHWLVAGGESGPGARAMRYDWAESALTFALINNIPFLFKQWGEWYPVHGVFKSGYLTSQYPLHTWDDHNISLRTGKKLSGRILEGREWNDYPVP